MAIFAVIPTGSDKQLDTVLSGQAWADSAYRLPRGEWLVAFDGTSIELSEALHISQEDGNGPAIVFAVNAYYGRASVSIWEWLKSRWK